MKWLDIIRETVRGYHGSSSGVSDPTFLLADRITTFLARHAKIAADYDPDFDPPEARFNGPDSALLHMAMEALRHGQKPPIVQSGWGSGCYRGDAIAQREHDMLVASVNQIARG